MSFVAASLGSPLRLQFRAGGTNLPRQADPELAYQDTFLEEAELEIAEQPARHALSLSGANYDQVISAFGWVLVDRGLTAPIEFVLDDIRWE